MTLDPRFFPVHRRLVFGVLLGLAACAGGEAGKGGAAGEGGVTGQDRDLDGYSGTEDCNDEDPAVHADAAEICDGVDNNCDGEVDEGVLTTWYSDLDDDGFGDAASPIEACSPDEGMVTNDTDCDDDEERVYPGAYDACDGLDNDCDGEIDEAESVTWYADEDGDGYGDPAAWVEACAAPDGYTRDDQDCDDTTAEAAPGAAEVCDEIDNDCDGDIDEAVTSTYYEDRDGDGWGLLAETTEACTRPTGYSVDAGDCDDTDVAYNPDALELDCTDPHDYNCDGSVGYADADGDGWAACEDCDDGDALVRPDGLEVCNGVDDDCDTLIDDADPSADLATGSTWYADTDGDGFGDAGVAVSACGVPFGYVSNTLDCDDHDSRVSPSATEICNEIDDDCDGDIDGDDASVDLSTGVMSYADVDGDGYGDASASAEGCLIEAGYVDNDSDCDDAAVAVNPAAIEVCNGYDDDCDLAIDDADGSLSLGSAGTWYQDSDGDGYGLSSSTTRACLEPAGYAAASADCDDGAGTVHPGATEVCDAVDNDCDTSVDEGWDADGDSITDCKEISHSVTLYLSVDDAWSGYIDGTSIGSGGGWSTVHTVTSTLDSGDHVLAIYGVDTGAAIAGFLAAVYIDGSLYSVSGDGKWKVGASGPSGWTTAAYNDAAWGTGTACTSSQMSTYWGGAPASLRATGASWIWSQSCTSLGAGYFRLNLTLP